jgi:hypothetical protein
MAHLHGNEQSCARSAVDEWHSDDEPERACHFAARGLGHELLTKRQLQAIAAHVIRLQPARNGGNSGLP